MLQERQIHIKNPIWQLKLKLLRFIMFITSIAFTTAVFLQVVMRYLFNYSLFGVEEFASFAGVIMYFVGAAYGTHERSHISASLVDTIFGEGRITAGVHAFTRLLSAILVVYILNSLWGLLVFTERMNTVSTELRLPMIWIYGTMFVGLALTAFYFLLEFIESFRATIWHAPNTES
ncbi:Tripartite ATP-independent periplasmic transporter, DctQ component [Pseudovibrio sp. Ad13]|uniref:TRAP transporter small permease n=1 Tax=unclassified Pseudovibrio TaxID=2627060 RepID=UPI0007AE5EBE|nr:MULTISPECIES: TRAP transporter small permease subunit [unclassified Pseudovibrio]KZK84915.1 Tripartite ATP-independent periplasmic transporter, DctQ component [Pseudovibrio sp. Ad13]KZK93643.1 Tripartite ATP-independent periplasmic transporter, DctQ component [Pseudovibrio sp. Ad5]KZK95299.1 Tripartite ATP-independent periplasmic transporter, DctQ component [Pseudovibrio sp. W74]KZL07281.1 Tripartite ATP-independent periplasmic transporter, DctQ component [Pseudovibrio sp. Ad14]